MFSCIHEAPGNVIFQNAYCLKWDVASDVALKINTSVKFEN